MQTRGKPALALLHGGGAVRDIELEAVQRFLQFHDLPCCDHVAEAIWRLLQDRLIMIDAAPVITRGDEAALERIEVAAEKLMKALSGYSATGDLMHTVETDLLPHQGYMDSGLTLQRWLIRLSHVRKRYFREFHPAAAYHEAICQLCDVIRDAGGNVAVHTTSRFMRFLLAVEAEKAGLIFPPETVQTERSRARYVERALSGRDSTN